MRQPFTLKNTIDDESLEVGKNTLDLDFEESIAAAALEDRLERGEATKRKLTALKLLLVGALGLISLRLYYLAVLQHDYFRQIAEGNRLRVEYLAAPRGAVYDANGEVLAANQPSFELVTSPLDVPEDPSEREQIIAEVSRIFAFPAEELKSILSNEQLRAHQSVLVKQNLSREQALIFHERAAALPGFRVVNVPIRDYRDAEASAHVLGYTGKITAEEFENLRSAGYLYNDSVGKTGLESVYESYLRGEFGLRQVEVDARGTVQKVYGEKTASPGKNLHLNLDQGLQKKLTKSLAERLRLLGRKKAAAIAINPQNGKVLAFLSLPSYDNNLFAQGISASDYQKLLDDRDEPLFNRGVQGTYPPGSIVKPMVASAGLAEGVITERTKIDDRGEIVIRNIFGGPDYYFYGYGRKALGVMEVRRAIALSSDIFFYIVGGGYDPVNIDGLGIVRLAKYFRKFGIGQTLGIDLPGERPGLVPTPQWKTEQFKNDPTASRWYLGDTYHVSIGQGDLLATPLQAVSWTAAIANGGKLWRPYLANRVEDRDGQVIKQYEPQMVADLGIAPQYLEIVREGMRQTVTEGTARSLSALPVSVAGKTGTAQFDASSPYRTHAWFTAFAPYENPQIAIVVLIEDGGEGSLSAAPVVKEVLNWWYAERYLKPR